MKRLAGALLLLGLSLLAFDGGLRLAAQGNGYYLASSECDNWTCQNNANKPVGQDGWPGYDSITNQPTFPDLCFIALNPPQPQIRVCLQPSQQSCYVALPPFPQRCNGWYAPPGQPALSCYVQWDQCSGTVPGPGGGD